MQGLANQFFASPGIAPEAFFGLLMGRQLQEQAGMKPQVVITMPILEGLDGVQKMSKSLNNYIGINDEPRDMFGKIMSISDDLMWRYFELLSFRPLDEIESFKTDIANGKNPRDVKFLLAEELETTPSVANRAVGM